MCLRKLSRFYIERCACMCIKMNRIPHQHRDLRCATKESDRKAQKMYCLSWQLWTHASIFSPPARQSMFSPEAVVHLYRLCLIRSHFEWNHFEISLCNRRNSRSEEILGDSSRWLILPYASFTHNLANVKISMHFECLRRFLHCNIPFFYSFRIDYRRLSLAASALHTRIYDWVGWSIAPAILQYKFVTDERLNFGRTTVYQNK